MLPYDWANDGSLDVLFLHGMVLVLWGVGAILGNEYRIQWQNYIGLLQGSKMPAGFHYMNFLLGKCFRLITLNIHW